MRLSKQQAAARLEVSTATIERKIQRGELKAEKEPHGSRYRVWVIFDDEPDVETAVESPVATSISHDAAPVPTGAATPPPDEIAAYVEIAKLQEQKKNEEDRAQSLEERARTLEELAEYHKKLLTDSEWRYQELLLELRQSQQNVAALTRALPAPKEDPEATTVGEAKARTHHQRRRRWWPFGKG